MERSPRSVDAIVESQVQRWLGERSRRTATPSTSPPPPVITVSREYGARGAAVARMVAEQLGYSYWDRELLAAIGDHARVDPALLAPFDEHHRSALLDTLRGLMPIAASPSQADYARELTAVASEIALRGRAVLVGRGLAFLIDPARCLRVRVVCPLEQRIAGVAKRDQVTTDDARARIEFADRDRQQFVRDLFGREVDDVTGYDVWVSTGALRLEAAADVIIAAHRGRFGEQTAARPGT